MARAGLLAGIAEPVQVIPAALVMGRTSRGVLDPGGNFASGPDATFGRLGLKRLGQGLLLGWGEQRTLTRMLGAAVGEAGVAQRVVAVDEGTDPFVTQADERGRRFCGLALGDEPQGLVAAGRGRRRGLLVALPKFLNSQMGRKLHSSCHNGIIHPAMVLVHRDNWA